jgi:hypothetical protein
MVVDGVGTIISTILASFSLFTGVHTYLLIVVAPFFLISMSHLVMLGGAFAKHQSIYLLLNAFGDSQAFNFKTMLIAIQNTCTNGALCNRKILSHKYRIIICCCRNFRSFAFRIRFQQNRKNLKEKSSPISQ